MYDVAIIGYGPVGAMLAALLGPTGRSVLVVEHETQVYPLPRAVHLDHEVFRLLSLIGVDDAVKAVSRPTSAYDFETADGDLLMGFVPSGENAPTGYPWSNLFYQPTLEHAMRAKVAKYPNIEVRIGVDFMSYADAHSDRVDVTLSDGPETPVSARYLVGCDGGRSLVRRQAGIALDDLDFNEPWMVVDVLLPDGRKPLHEASRQICDPERPVTSIPIGSGRHRWEFMLLPGETAETVASPSVLNALVESQLPDDLTLADITVERSAVYTFHGVFAERWREGRVLLAGDAAHQMPPFMGQGLCSGIRDAANLAWKLDAVLGGKANEQLLSTLQPEREPQIRFITETAIGMGKIVCTHDVEQARARDEEMCGVPREDRISPMPALPPLTQGVLDTPLSGEPLAWDAQVEASCGYRPILLVNGPSLPAIGTPIVDSTNLHTVTRPIGEGASPWSDALAKQCGGFDAVLARPDRTIFGSGDPGELVAAYAAYLETGNISG